MNSTSKLLPALLALVALAAGILLSLNYNNKPDEIAQTQTTIPGLLWPNPKQITAFHLIDQNSETFDLEKLKGHWSMIFFGYTHCPDVCPITMTLLKSVVGELSIHNEPLPQVIFVTVDPERDTPQHLADYVAYFNPDFLGLSGSKENISALTRQLGILAMKVPDKNATNDTEYLMDHSASILLLDPEARLTGIFSAPHDSVDIKQRYLAIRHFIEQQK